MRLSVVRRLLLLCLSVLRFHLVFSIQLLVAVANFTVLQFQFHRLFVHVIHKGAAEHELAHNTEAGSRPEVILENLLPRRQ